MATPANSTTASKSTPSASQTQSSGDDQATHDEKSFLVIDCGKQKSKHVKNLRKGKGKLMDRIADLLDDLEAEGEATDGPVILVVERKQDRKKKFSLF